MNNPLPITPTASDNMGLIAAVAKQWNIQELDSKTLYDTLVKTAFKPVKKGKDVYITPTREQIVALMIVAKQYNLNPFLKEIYAFPAKDGSIVPIVSVDGWANIINSHPNYDGLEFTYAEEQSSLNPRFKCPDWIECKIYRKDRAKPTAIREYLDECYKDSDYENPWKTHTKRFLRHKALIQCARIAFGFAGIYDEDEGMRIMDGKEAINVTPTEPKPDPVREKLLSKESVEMVLDPEDNLIKVVVPNPMVGEIISVQVDKPTIITQTPEQEVPFPGDTYKEWNNFGIVSKGKLIEKNFKNIDEAYNHFISMMKIRKSLQGRIDLSNENEGFLKALELTDRADLVKEVEALVGEGK